MKKKEKRTGRSWRKKALTGILAVSMILQTSGMSLFAEENAGITKEAVLSESEDTSSFSGYRQSRRSFRLGKYRCFCN